MRGSLVAISKRHAAAGIIPAGAGLTYRPSCYYARNRDHPRGCGAHSTRARQSVLRQGSSPRVRGSHSIRVARALPSGIIPAGAGLTEQHDHEPQEPGDHPRGCGAHDKALRLVRGRKGSSPRVRGSQRRKGNNQLWKGIIPAGAGLTSHVHGGVMSGGDHPRGCGAHSLVCIAT